MRKLGILLGMMTISILVYCQENATNSATDHTHNR